MRSQCSYMIVLASPVEASYLCQSTQVGLRTSGHDTNLFGLILLDYRCLQSMATAGYLRINTVLVIAWDGFTRKGSSERRIGGLATASTP